MMDSIDTSGIDALKILTKQEIIDFLKTCMWGFRCSASDVRFYKWKLVAELLKKERKAYFANTISAELAKEYNGFAVLYNSVTDPKKNLVLSKKLIDIKVRLKKEYQKWDRLMAKEKENNKLIENDL